MSLFFKRYSLIAGLLSLCAIPRASYAATSYSMHKLVSDLPGMADQMDLNLVNPWGIAASRTSPLWISNNRSGTATVYNGSGQPFPPAGPLVVKVPAPSPAKPTSSPTGQVSNDTTGFVVAGKPSSFLFATEDGTISAWNSSVGVAGAVLMIDNSGSGAVYKGLALAVTSSGAFLYTANFKSGTIDVFDANFSPAALDGSFSDPNLPQGFAPFNIQLLGRKLYVAYAKQDETGHDDISGPGNGFVDVFDANGHLLQRLISNGRLNSPWGLALSPGNFGDFSNALLVGNFGDGTINAFEPCSGEFLGTLKDSTGSALSIPGLWGLQFGNGGQGSDPNSMFFTAGIPGPGSIEDHGLLGTIQVSDAAPAAPALTPPPAPTPPPDPPPPPPPRPY